MFPPKEKQDPYRSLFFFALRYNYLLQPYSTILLSRLHNIIFFKITE